MVDISFNQLTGLCALSFLEDINRNMQPMHMLKKSIILVRTTGGVVAGGGWRVCVRACVHLHA